MTPDRPEPVSPASARPTPVRVGAPRVDAAPEPAPAARPWVHSDGRAFEVEVVGRARTSGAVVGAELILLRFRAGEEGAADVESLVAAASLSALSDREIEEHFERGRPFQAEPAEESGFFDGTRRGRSGRS